MCFSLNIDIWKYERSCLSLCLSVCLSVYPIFILCIAFFSLHPHCDVRRRVLSFGFYSIFYYNYQVLALLLWSRTLRPFGREPASRTGQRMEWKFSSSSSSSSFFFLLSFTSSRFPRRTTILRLMSETQKRDMSAPPPFLPLSLSLASCWTT